jgi:hypothetical protein
MLPLNVTGVEFTVEEAVSVLQPLIILILGIVIYSVFIFKFYRYMAKKDVLELNLKKYNEGKTGFIGAFLKVVFYFVEYLLVFPVIIFFWFLVIVLFIGIVSSRAFDHVLLAGMGLIAATRVTAYYNEDLSRDLAKMIPFALLGIFIIDVKFLSFSELSVFGNNLLLVWKNVLYYLFLTFVLETVLRVVSGFLGLFKKSTPAS